MRSRRKPAPSSPGQHNALGVSEDRETSGAMLPAKNGNALYPTGSERAAMGWPYAATGDRPWNHEHRLGLSDSVHGWMPHLNVPHLRASHVATVGELSAAIAHEVNQPLAAVITNAEVCQIVLGSEAPDIQLALRSLDRIVEEAQRGAEIVRRMRSLFRRSPPDKEHLDLNDVIHEVVRMLADELHGKCVTLTVNLAVLPRVAADRVQVQQVLLNLMRNGIEAMDGLSGRPKLLSVSSRRAGAEVVVEVSDEGVGVQDPGSIFAAFYTTKPGGMGMGLAVSRSIVEAHGGRMWVTDNAPCGATFGVALRAEEAT